TMRSWCVASLFGCRRLSMPRSTTTRRLSRTTASQGRHSSRASCQLSRSAAVVGTCIN
ncbi:hypothetical protein N0V85_008263, partial [Neurospora sp. IMI 360204]